MSVIIALDVDGVLNCPRAAGHTPHQLHLPANVLPKHQYIRGWGEKDLHGQVWLANEDGAAIRAWQGAGADVRWCTTWGEGANFALAPLLGIDPLPVIPLWEGQAFGNPWDEGVGRWKMEALSNQLPEGALIWIDDHAFHSLKSSRRGATLVIRVDPADGMTENDKAEVGIFLRDHS